MSLIKPLIIGAVTLPNNLLLAPMAGYTDLPFRRLCKDFGAGLTVTEMVSARGLAHNGKKTEELLNLAGNETPSCAQLFGSLPADFSAALQKDVLKKFDIIDVNMGCPMPKITRNGDGSALLNNPGLAAAIVEACVKAGRTVTAKVRLGISDTRSAVDFCRALESAGASAVTVHGRTAAQLYGGRADWDAIGTVAAKLSVPVIGNGDVNSREEAESRIRQYGVAGVMIGRGAIGRPGIFGCTTHRAQRTPRVDGGRWMADGEEELNQITNADGDCAVGRSPGSAAVLPPHVVSGDGAEPPPYDTETPSLPIHYSLFTIQSHPALSLQEIILKHIAYALEAFPEAYAVTTLRKHFVYYLKGIPGVKSLKAELNRVSDARSLTACVCAGVT